MIQCMDALRSAYDLVRQERTKERFDMILEPFQAITQLALLSYCPVGTKLSIHQNLLYVQEPTWIQAVKRTYNADKKDDLVFLFGIIIRFHKFYGFMRTNNDNQKYLFKQLIDLAKLGIDKLTQTYNHIGPSHLTQTLKMYRSMLEQPEFAIATDRNTDMTIDTVFAKVVSLYENEHYEILANAFKLISNNPDSHERYRVAINAALEPVTNKLQTWISDNIVF